MESTRFIFTTRIVLSRPGEVLLLKRRKSHGKGYSMPGGTVERGESILKATVRECKEEIGITVYPQDLQLIHVQRHYKGKNREELVYFYKAERYTGELFVRERQKFKKVKWKPLAKLPRKLSGYIRHAMREWQKDRAFSEYFEKDRPEDNQEQPGFATVIKQQLDTLAASTDDTDEPSPLNRNTDNAHNGHVSDATTVAGSTIPLGGGS